MQKGDFKSEVFGDVYSRQIYIGEQDSNKKLLTRQEIEALITKVSFENDSKLKSLAQCASDLIELANWRSRIIDVCVNWYSAIGNLLKSSQESVADIQKVSNSINSATYANISNSTYSTYLADAGAISSYVENHALNSNQVNSLITQYLSNKVISAQSTSNITSAAYSDYLVTAGAISSFVRFYNFNAAATSSNSLSFESINSSTTTVVKNFNSSDKRLQFSRVSGSNDILINVVYPIVEDVR